MIDKEILKTFNNKAKRDTRIDKLKSFFRLYKCIKIITIYQTDNFINPKYKFFI